MKISLYISRYITIIRWYTEKSKMWIFGTILNPILNDTFWSTLSFLVNNFVSYFILFWKDFQGLKCKQPKGIEQQAGKKKERITKNRPIMKLALFFLQNFSISKTDCIRMGMWWFYSAEQVISTIATCSPQKWVSQDNGRLFFFLGGSCFNAEHRLTWPQCHTHARCTMFLNIAQINMKSFIPVVHTMVPLG